MDIGTSNRKKLEREMTFTLMVFCGAIFSYGPRVYRKGINQMFSLDIVNIVYLIVLISSFIFYRISRKKVERLYRREYEERLNKAICVMYKSKKPRLEIIFNKDKKTITQIGNNKLKLAVKLTTDNENITIMDEEENIVFQAKCSVFGENELIDAYDIEIWNEKLFGKRIKGDVLFELKLLSDES